MSQSSLLIFHRESWIRTKLMSLVIPPDDLMPCFQSLIKKSVLENNTPLRKKMTQTLKLYQEKNNLQSHYTHDQKRCKALRYFIEDNSQPYKLFENIILTIIIISSLFLVLDSPVNDPNSSLKLTIFYIDSVFTFIFMVEALIKIIAFGFIFTSLEK